MPVQTETIQIAAPGGTMPAHIAIPEGNGPFPAVVVLIEAFGLLSHIRAVADRLAGEGYIAIAPDLYYRMAPDNTAGYDELPKAIGLMGKLDHGEFTGDMAATLDALAARSDVEGSRIGVTGFCMGGLLTFLSACALPDRVKAAAPFYGGGIASLLDRAGDIQAPLHLFFGAEDAFIPLDQVKAIEAKLGELGKTFDLDVYEGAQHGFFCDERAEYDSNAAKDAWRKLTAFFAKNLKKS